MNGKLTGHAVEYNTSLGIKWQGEFVNGTKNYLNGYANQITPISNLLKRRAISSNSITTADESEAERTPTAQGSGKATGWPNYNIIRPIKIQTQGLSESTFEKLEFKK